MEGATKKILLASLTAFLVSGGIFFAIAWCTSTFNAPSEQEQDQLDTIKSLLEDKLEVYDVYEDFEAVIEDNLREYLRNLTSIPHMAGKYRDEELAEYVRDKFIEFGFDQVKLNPYKIRLSYPDEKNPNLITLSNDERGTFFTSKYREIIEGVDLDSEFVDGFLAFSPPGTFTGQVVYVNYGRTEDYELISNPQSQYYTDTTDKICIARYGKIFRGNKVENAYLFGCKAAILFSDPAEVAPYGTEAKDVYPNTEFLPESGIQRGSTYLANGDPDTPLWPSIEDVYRLPEDEMRVNLPKIPAQPIGYGDAQKILEQMEGKNPPEDWKGKIEGVSYTIGGRFKASCGTNCRVTVDVHTDTEMTTSSNVIAVLKGDVEPDRYVLIGNHRDAWGYGAVDPNSGTATIIEAARILGDKVRNSNWRPRRSIVFLSWGAEEFGLIGSREFAEDYSAMLEERSVTYINVDTCVKGPILGGAGTPTVSHKILEASKNVPNPWNEFESYYDYWARWWTEAGFAGTPDVDSLPGAGSDHANFVYLLGIPAIDIGFDMDTKIQFPGATNYPVYHTGFETFEAMNEILDPEFKISATCTRMTLNLGRDFSDEVVLDFNLEEYVTLMKTSLAALTQAGQIDLLNSIGVETNGWTNMIDSFDEAVKQWRGRFNMMLLNATSLDPILARRLNDEAMKVDRAFIMPKGLPGNPQNLHAIISPSQFNSYGAGVFPGITDLLHNFDQLPVGSAEYERRVKDLKIHVSDLMIVIKQARDFLTEEAF